MKLKGSFGIIMLAITLIFAMALVANAGMSSSADQQSATSGLGKSSGHGAMRVDRDLATRHENDSNQFGDDLAQDGSKGRNKEADSQANQWKPDSYGQMGSYGHDER